MERKRKDKEKIRKKMKNENKLSLMFTILIVAGKSMGQANSLSKRADWIEGVEKDNEN